MSVYVYIALAVVLILIVALSIDIYVTCGQRPALAPSAPACGSGAGR